MCYHFLVIISIFKLIKLKALKFIISHWPPTTPCICSITICLCVSVLRIKSRSLCMLGKNSTTA